MNRSKSKNLYFKWPSRKNFLVYKNEKNKCNNMIKNAKKAYFRKVTAKKTVNHFVMQSNPFSLIQEPWLMITLLLKKTESLKITQKKQQKFLITTV